MIGDYYTRSMTLSRLSSEILPPTDVAASIPIVTNPARAAYLEISLYNNGVAGIVYVNGTSSGAASTEAVSFPTGSSVRRTLSAFSALTSLTLSGITGASLSARAVAGGGEPVFSEVVEEKFNGAIRAQSGRIRALQQGSSMIADYELSRMNSDKLAERKIIKDLADGKRYEIVFISPPGPHGNVLCDLHLLP